MPCEVAKLLDPLIDIRGSLRSFASAVPCEVVKQLGPLIDIRGSPKSFVAELEYVREAALQVPEK